ncbi:MAG: peptidoglycan-binding domain-containing protein [Phormidesmis sp.]
MKSDINLIWSLEVTMKPFAVCSLSLGVVLTTLSQPPAVASNSAVNSGSSQHGEQPAVSSPQLVAVALTVTSLRPGDEGADVRALQRYLSRNGLYSFMIDGVYGQDTSNAVATYQRIRNLQATGIADRETLADMEFDFLPGASPTSSAIPLPPSSGSPAIRSGSLVPGSSGTDVVALQQRLTDFGFPVFVDGIYGLETQQAVRTYQRVQGLPVTGGADRETLRSMSLSTSSGGASNQYRYVAAVIASSAELSNVREFFEDAYVDRDRRGEFINIGNFDTRFPAEAKVNAAIARGFRTRVLYR